MNGDTEQARLRDPQTCPHDNIEPLAELVTWCPECGTRWSTTREELARVHDLFMEKLSARYPNHPWLTLDMRK